MTDSLQTLQANGLEQDFVHEEQRGYTSAEENANGYRKPTLTFREAVKTCLIEKYCCFKGRARRSELWWFMLLTFVISFTTYLVSTIFLFISNSYFYQGTIYHNADSSSNSLLIAISIVQGIIALALLLPSMGAAIRRLHDIGKSGWYYGAYLLSIVVLYAGLAAYIYSIKSNPFAFSITIPFMLSFAMLAISVLFIILLCKDGERNDNKYGPSPKYVSNYNAEYAKIYRPFEFKEALRECLANNYCNFRGRARRSEYWWFQLFLFIQFFAIINLTLLFSIPFAMIFEAKTTISLMGIIVVLILLALLLPTIGVTVRRLHDVGKSGTLYLLFIISVIIARVLSWFNSYSYSYNSYSYSYDTSMDYILRLIYFFIAAFGCYITYLLCLDSQPYENDWGPSPKYEEQDEPDYED